MFPCCCCCCNCFPFFHMLTSSPGGCNTGLSTRWRQASKPRNKAGLSTRLRQASHPRNKAGLSTRLQSRPLNQGIRQGPKPDFKAGLLLQARNQHFSDSALASKQAAEIYSDKGKWISLCCTGRKVLKKICLPSLALPPTPVPFLEKWCGKRLEGATSVCSTYMVRYPWSGFSSPSHHWLLWWPAQDPGYLAATSGNTRTVKVTLETPIIKDRHHQLHNKSHTTTHTSYSSIPPPTNPEFLSVLQFK